MKRILITGITGFVGQYLAEYLLENSPEIELHGTYHSEEGLNRLGQLRNRLLLHQADIIDEASVKELISTVRPQEIYHLAAQSNVSDSFKDPVNTFTTNVVSEIHLLEAIRQLDDPSVRILIVSTSEVYGMVAPEDLPIDEQTPLRPSSPYAVSKLATDYLALQYHYSYKLQTLRARPFNHVGPRQSTKYVVPSFAKQIAEIEKGGKEPVIKVGNLTAKKDFTDVRDIVRGYVLLMEKGISGEVYNIGSGRSLAIEELLKLLLDQSHVNVKVEIDPSLVRPVEIPELRCDYSKFHELTGWEPEIPLEQTLKDTLDYFRKLV